jgi:hypothetical protein
MVRPLVPKREELSMGQQYYNGRTHWEFGTPIYSYGQVVRTILGPCPSCGSVTSTYGGGYSCHNDYCQHSASVFACNAGPKPDWWNTEIRVFRDGNAWCAVGAGFTNIQESDAGFGDTPQAAVDDLKRPNSKISGP